MKLLLEYRQSLKEAAIEEWFDLAVYRPLGFLVAKIAQKIKLTPVFLTYTAVLLIFCIPILLFLHYTWQGLLLLNIVLIFDCADGQLARLTNTSSIYGRALDGFIDYFALITAYISIAVHFFYQSQYSFFLYIVLFLLVGLSVILQAQSLDYYRSIYLVKDSSVITNWQSELKYIQNELLSQNLFRRIVYFSYKHYLQKQIHSFQKSNLLKVTIRQIQTRLFYGTSTHISLLTICALYNRLDIYMWITFILNIYMFLLKLLKF